MANNVVQVKRTSTAGRTPNTTGSYATNSQYISSGELALNMADGILYTSNGSALITVGANVVNLNVTGNATIKGIIANGSIGTANQVLTSNGTGIYWSTSTSSSNVASRVYSVTTASAGQNTFTTTTSFLSGTADVYLNGVHLSSSEFSVLSSNSIQLTENAQTGAIVEIVAWESINPTSSVTSVSTGNGLTGGPITSVGTISVIANNGLSANSTGVYVVPGNGLIASNSTGVHVGAGSGVTVNSTAVAVLANTGIVANATGVYVNATYIGTLSANNATNLNGQPASYYTNATNITTGTLPYAQIPANIINTTAAFTRTGITTFSANVVLGTSGLSANGSFGTATHVLHSNGTATYWAADDQGVTLVATGNGLTGGTITATGTISVIANNGLSANSTGVYVVPGNGLIASNSTGVHVGAGSGVTVNSTTVAVLANNGLVANSTGLFVTPGNGLIASNSTGVHVGAGSGVTVNSTTVAVLANNGLVANSTGLFVTPGNGLIASNSTGVHVGAGSGVTVNSTAVAVLANTGIVANATGTFVNAAYINTISSNSATYANGSITNTFTVGTGTYFVANGNVGIGTTSPAATLDVSGTYSLAGANVLSQTLTDGATITWNTSLGQIATVTLGGNRTMAAPTNLKIGTYVLNIIQDGTGGRTLTWNAVFKWPAAVAPTLTTTASRRDIIFFYSDGTNLYGSFLPDVR